MVCAVADCLVQDPTWAPGSLQCHASYWEKEYLSQPLNLGIPVPAYNEWTVGDIELGRLLSPTIGYSPHLQLPWNTETTVWWRVLDQRPGIWEATWGHGGTLANSHTTCQHVHGANLGPPAWSIPVTTAHVWARGYQQKNCPGCQPSRLWEIINNCEFHPQVMGTLLPFTTQKVFRKSGSPSVCWLLST